MIKKTLPEHPWHYGKFNPVIFVAAIVWSFVLCIVLVVSDPIHVGLGLVGVVVAGCVIYLCIPKSRRGASHVHLGIFKSGAQSKRPQRPATTPN